MKKYIEPKIKAIKLDPEQALLEICAVGGLYLNPGTTPPICISVSYPSGPPLCEYS